MEDSNGMAIEFLWTRLLFKRSVSKSARQRADEMAKKQSGYEVRGAAEGCDSSEKYG
ncbi:hypothetical protein TanjilG_08485 [Lupinus angustifolius]|uniref:Uncharacterized protein n=1 Tax=Lupinus angustifolius TaxID=3871 RepID=A0A4P1QZZ9_LUPAN|nr:hypothetical protein TanjilG_08485 [Lupinus angustifolius]